MYIISTDTIANWQCSFVRAENTTGQENMGDYVQWRKVGPTLTIFEVCGDRQGVMGSG